MSGAWRASSRLAWQVLRAEGGGAFRDRLLDRFAAWQRRRSFRTVAVESPGEVAGNGGQQLPQVPVLNLLSTLPRTDLGGVQIQLLRRLAAEAVDRPCALMYPQASGYRLEIASGERRIAIELRATLPVSERLEDPAFEAAIRHAAARIDASVVHCEQLVGWPLASVAKLRSSGLRLVVSVHDFGLFCLRPHLLERPMMRFCGFSRDAERCWRCLRCDWAVGSEFQAARRARAAELLRCAEAVIFPSDFLRRTYRELMPELTARRLEVVAPPSVEGQPVPPRSDSQIRHLAAVGSAKALKGTPILAELVQRFPRDRFPQLRWSVYGGGNPSILRQLRRLPGVRVRGYYRAGHLPQRLVDDRVDLALLLSITPESYSLTFDECLQAGVPALAFDHGAIADRVRRLGGGALADPRTGVDGLAERLHEMLDGGVAVSPPSVELPDADSAAGAMRRIYAAVSTRRS